jgi:hypothetical protein
MTETEAKWAGRVSEWRQSGKAAEEFAEGMGFEASTLRYWASRLKKAKAEPGGNAPNVRLARVVRRERSATVVGAADAGVVIEVGRARVTVRRGFDASVLREVLDALQSSR